VRANLPLIGLLAAAAALAAYLYTGAPLDGDGAAYALQARAGRPLDRAIHVGALMPLWLWVRAFGPGAANAFGLVAAAAAIAGVDRLGRALAPEAGRGAGLLAPAVLLGAAASWQAALFVEVYGPLAALAVWTVVALRAERPATAGALFGWMVLVHPGAVALGPGLLLIGGRRPSGRSAVAAAAVVLPAWALLWPAPWSGPRGLGALPAFDLSPWESLQRAWRLLARDLGVTAAPVIVGAAALWARDRRAVLGVGAVALGAALAVDRYADNAGQLPALWLACALAPAALRWTPAGATRRVAWTLALLCLLGVAEATSRHDRLRRRTERSFADEETRCGEEAGDWAQAMRRAVACADGGPTAP
jgi:hypothetical protein